MREEGINPSETHLLRGMRNCSSRGVDVLLLERRICPETVIGETVSPIRGNCSEVRVFDACVDFV